MHSVYANRLRRPGFAIIAIFAVIVVLQLVWVSPGPFTVDEVTYQKMTHELVNGGGLFIHNGYEDVPSIELTTLLVLPTAAGKLAAQYPYGTAVLGAAPYELFGLRGPFLLSALALSLSLFLCYRIAFQFLRDRFVAVVAPVLLATTFFTEYGLAAWPHMTMCACVLSAFSLGVSGHQCYVDNRRRALWLYLASGACMGLAMTLRLDALLSIPAIGAPLLLCSPTRVRGMFAFALGLVPATLFIVVTNYVRWHELSPMSYGPQGHSASIHLPYFVALVLGTTVVWLASRPRSIGWTRKNPKIVLLSVLLLVLGVVLVRPHPQRDVLEMMTALHSIVSYITDLRIRPDVFTSAGESTAISYAGALKKALLQSVPFLVLVAIPILRALRVREQRATTAWLFVAPAVRAAFFGVFVWHGGMCLNLRYLLSSLPFLSILSAIGIRELLVDAPRRWWLAAVALAAPALAITTVLFDASSPVPDQTQELIFLTVPLVIGAILLASIVWWYVSRRPAASLIALSVAGAALGWTVGVSVDDARWSRDYRDLNYTVSKCLAGYVPDHSLIIAESPDATYGVAASRNDVRIAFPILDTFATSRDLIAAQLAHGHRAYAAAGPLLWKLMRWYGVLDGYAVDTIARTATYVLGEIRPARPGEKLSGVFADITSWEASCGPDATLSPAEFDPRLGPDLVRTPRKQ